MGALTNRFEGSVAECESLRPADAALVEAGRRIAVQIDEVVAHGSPLEVTKALYLLPHLVNILREMLATPASRLNAKAGPPAVGGRLEQLRQQVGAAPHRPNRPRRAAS